MHLRLKNNRFFRWIGWLNGGLLAVLLLFWGIRGDVWTRWDFQALDYVYKYAARSGKTLPLSLDPLSPDIVYLVINDETYQEFGENRLNRRYLAKLNDVLAVVRPQAVAYDIIFPQPSEPEADEEFRESLKHLEHLYLPLTVETLDLPVQFQWESGSAYDLLRTQYLQNPIEKGRSTPLYGRRAFMQYEPFAETADNSGNITVAADPDGVYRHQIALLKVAADDDHGYLPALSLAMFLDDVGVAFEHVVVEWGREIRIPAQHSPILRQDVVIPIDDRGRMFIPYSQPWEHPEMKNYMISAQKVLQLFANPDTQWMVEEFFSGKFVFIADISMGIPDLGQTPLENDVPLIVMHTSFLNGLLTNTFYRQWSFIQVIGLLCGMAAILMLVSLLRPRWPLFLTGSIIALGVIISTVFQFLNFRLFPVVSVGGSFLFLFIGLATGLEVVHHTFIRWAFSRYVPETVIRELLDHPEKLQLGGEKRTISIFFSDLQGFTTISESLSPEQLVSLLNTYLSEMTTIILEHGGTIDKFLGDAIMAEFGMPLPLPDHADRAVSAALRMHRRLAELRTTWEARGLPELHCRIGINTGEVVIGNMGSHDVFDYTVIGDEANLASRLEGANKLYHTYLMISEATYNALTPGRFQTRLLDVITVKGKTRPVKVFEVYGETSMPVPPEHVAYYQTYHEGFEAYLSREFSLALERFNHALGLRPDDPAAQGLISRIHAINPESLPEDWDGAITLTSK